MALTGTQKKGNETEPGDEDDLEGEKEARKVSDLGPPGFYEADLDKYYKKFDLCLKERTEFKKKMKDQMSFTNQEWNRNVEKQGTSQGLARSKQVTKYVNGKC